jgi:uncharacterized protein (TIGR03067 family)
MKLAIAFGLAALVLTCQARAQDEQKREASDGVELIGGYEIVAGERGGEEISPDRLQDVKVRIGAKDITTFDKDKKEVYAATYELDTSRKPWRITMTATLPSSGKGEKAAGLIQIDGDTLKLIYALPGGKPPVDFKTGEKQQMFVLKRAEK